MYKITLRICIPILVLFFSCKGSTPDGHALITNISDPQTQVSLYNRIIDVANDGNTAGKLKDSIAFLFLPVDAACPGCRQKTIDSIDLYKRNMKDNRFVVISGKGSKLIRSYFEKQKKELPQVYKNIFIDSTNQSFLKNLVHTRPTIYYINNGKVYQKIACVPINIKDELHKFFSADKVVAGIASVK